MQRLDVAETTEAQAWGSVEQVREADVGQAGRRNPYNKGDGVCMFSTPLDLQCSNFAWRTTLTPGR